MREATDLYVVVSYFFLKPVDITKQQQGKQPMPRHQETLRKRLAGTGHKVRHKVWKIDLEREVINGKILLFTYRC